MFLIPQSSYTIRTIKGKGRGVFAARDIEAGTVIGDYIGTIMDSKKENEKRDGLYSMAGGKKYDILGNPKIKGIHLINHSCANNCDTYPYEGHILFFALRKIFKGEELSINYWLYAADEKDITCNFHACYCESAICTGTMHSACKTFDEWDKLLKKQFGPWYRKIPGKYGEQLAPLPHYPSLIKDIPALYNAFGSEKKTAQKYEDAALPTIAELKKRIRETGRQLSMPKLRMTIYGIQDGMMLARII